MTQEQFCKKQDVVCHPSRSEQIMGIADNVGSRLFPINGLRHPVEGETCGWYIWAGEELSNEADFFKPLHVQHFIEQYPEIEKFLGLPPGWRFLYTSEYEDIWFDASLLDID